MLRIDQASFVIAREGCYVCGRGGPVADTEVNIEGEGSLALCGTCVLDMANTLGLDVRRPKGQKAAR